MIDAKYVESLLQEAIALLEESGFPMAAESLRDNLRGIRTAPTGGARRRRIFQLRDLFGGTGPGPDVFHGTAAIGPSTERYRLTLEAIQTLLAPGAPDEELDGTAWTPSVARVA
jgi:hypothetical protein